MSLFQTFSIPDSSCDHNETRSKLIRAIKIVKSPIVLNETNCFVQITPYGLLKLALEIFKCIPTYENKMIFFQGSKSSRNSN